MANPDRLSALDTAFLHLEDDSTAHMHVASVMVFEGVAPTHQELIDHVLSRLHLVPRYRQRLAYVPLGQGRPLWTDDPHFNPRYHIRHTALPRPADEAALKQLAGRLFSQRLDRSKPLWEIWLVQRMAGRAVRADRQDPPRARGRDLRCGHHDRPVRHLARARRHRPGRRRRGPPSRCRARPSCSARRCSSARPFPPRWAAARARCCARRARSSRRSKDSIASVGATTLAGISAPAPPSPFNVDIGPHRRYTWVDADLAQFKAIKDSLGGTLNDVVLASVSLALGRYLRAQGQDTEGLVLKAMVPVSVRADSQRGALGNQVAAMWAPLPVGVENPADCLAQIRDAMEDLKESGQAVGAQVLTNLAGFAPPTILSQAARLQARQRFFNLVVTNVPGPQFPLYLLGRRLRGLYPVVPLARRQALGIAVMSYDGRLGFGLLADYDAVPELEAIARDLDRAIASLARAAGVRPAGKRSAPRKPPARANRPRPTAPPRSRASAPARRRG